MGCLSKYGLHKMGKMRHRTNTQFCKHILGINRSSKNHLTRYETGGYPIKSNID